MSGEPGENGGTMPPCMVESIEIWTPHAHNENFSFHLKYVAIGTSNSTHFAT